MYSLRVKWVLTILFIGFITTPAVIFFFELFVKNITIRDLVNQLLNGQFKEGDNIFLLSVYGLIPFALHSLFCHSFGEVFNNRVLNCYGLIGIVSIMSCMVPMHFFAWIPVYRGDLVSSTSVLVFIVIPWFCVLSLGLGLCLSWAVTRHKYFKQHAPNEYG